MTRLVSVLIVTLGTAAAFGQSAAELHSKYPTIEVYKVRPSVWMTPSYAVDGQVCKMILEKRHTTTENGETVIDEASSFTEADIHELLGQLVPDPERGERMKGPGYWLNTTINGGAISTVDTYDNVMVEVAGFLGSSQEENLRSHSKATAVSGDKHDAGTAPSPDHEKMVILITWRKRQCIDNTQATKRDSPSLN